MQLTLGVTSENKRKCNDKLDAGVDEAIVLMGNILGNVRFSKIMETNTYLSLFFFSYE